MTDFAQLQQRFDALLQRLGATGTDGAFEALVKGYRHPPRFYHSIDHVGDVLGQLDVAAAHVDEIQALPDADRQRFLDTVELAIWYHDIVYDATKHDNEALSADVMVTAAASLGIDAAVIDDAKNAILITAHHSDAATLSEKIIADCDLHTLGLPWDKFIHNSAMIRREYAHVPDDIYVVARAKALTGLLGKGAIYKTAAFAERYELKAQANIKRLALESAVKPCLPPPFKK